MSTSLPDFVSCQAISTGPPASKLSSNLNRDGLVIQSDLTQADGHAERRAALDMAHRHPRPDQPVG